MVFAALDPAKATLWVAAIAAIGTLVNTIVGSRTKKSIGTKNGQGNLVEMNERQLKQHAEVKAELAIIKDLIVTHVTDIEVHGGFHGSSQSSRERRAH